MIKSNQYTYESKDTCEKRSKNLESELLPPWTALGLVEALVEKLDC